MVLSSWQHTYAWIFCSALYILMLLLLLLVNFECDWLLTIWNTALLTFHKTVDSIVKLKFFIWKVKFRSKLWMRFLAWYKSFNFSPIFGFCECSKSVIKCIGKFLLKTVINAPSHVIFNNSKLIPIKTYFLFLNQYL